MMMISPVLFFISSISLYFQNGVQQACWEVVEKRKIDGDELLVSLLFSVSFFFADNCQRAEHAYFFVFLSFNRKSFFFFLSLKQNIYVCVYIPHAGNFFFLLST